jgi:hypothetical protein
MPAGVAEGGEVHCDVAEALIRDTRRDPDQLPLTQHALSYIWLRKRAAGSCDSLKLTLADYREDANVGNASNALSSHVEE